MPTIFINLIRSRRLILNMSLNDFKNRYSGSYFGLVWAIIQPIATILIFWFVFQVGFRAQPVADAPFILWLCAGMVPWSFFNDALMSGTGAFTSYSFIVKKLVFNTGILPLIKVLSSFYLSLIFTALLLLVFTLYGFFPGIHFLSVLYFNACLFFLVSGLSYLLATINVFFRDTTQIVGICLQFGMWLTPIMWSETMIPARFHWIVKINPLYYIVNGMRDALIGREWFLIHPLQTIYFWIVTVLICVFGLIFYKKMKFHFADVL